MPTVSCRHTESGSTPRHLCHGCNGHKCPGDSGLGKPLCRYSAYSHTQLPGVRTGIILSPSSAHHSLRPGVRSSYVGMLASAASTPASPSRLLFSDIPPTPNTHTHGTRLMDELLTLTSGDSPIFKIMPQTMSLNAMLIYGSSSLLFPFVPSFLSPQAPRGDRSGYIAPWPMCPGADIGCSESCWTPPSLLLPSASQTSPYNGAQGGLALTVQRNQNSSL